MPQIRKPVLPPGTLLQLMYVRARLRRLAPGRFVEIGVGHGALSRLLLDLGWRGVGWDLNEHALEAAAALNADAIAERRYELTLANWLEAADEGSQSAGLVVSSMVLEHLDDDDERRYFRRAAETLRPDGRVVLLVPGSPRHWGIEDEIAGHQRRYTFETLRHAAESSGFSVEQLAGLTFPLSNLLLPLSNRRVRRCEADKMSLDLERRTVESGDRHVPWKTSFPAAAGLVLNEAVLFPFDLLQRVNSRSHRSLVLYCECRPDGPIRAPAG